MDKLGDKWESGEITYEPIRAINAADKFLVAEYVQKQGLLDEWHKKHPSLKLRQEATCKEC